MKSIFKKALLGLALSSCAAFASATMYTSTIFVPADYNHPGTLKTFAINGYNVVDDNTNTAVMGSIGDTFQYDFVFDLPDETSAFAFHVNDGNGSVAFDGASFGFFPLDAYDPMDGVIKSASATGVSGGSYLYSANYDLRLTGSYLVNGGGFGGDASAVSVTVPEPMSLSLIGLGLAGMAGLRRRKAA